MDHLAESEATAPKTDTSGIRVPPPVYYVAGFLVGVALELMFPTSWPPFGIRLAAMLLAAPAWLALDGAAMVLFRRAETSMVPMNPTTALVTSGPYRLTRNPMYLGMAFLCIAFAFALGVIWALAFLPVVVVIVDRFVIAREEPYLERKFGQAYRVAPLTARSIEPLHRSHHADHQERDPGRIKPTYSTVLWPRSPSSGANALGAAKEERVDVCSELVEHRRSSLDLRSMLPGRALPLQT